MFEYMCTHMYVPRPLLFCMHKYIYEKKRKKKRKKKNKSFFWSYMYLCIQNNYIGLYNV